MAADSSPGLWPPLKIAAVGALVLTAATTFLTWTSRNGVDSWGLAHDDAFLVIAASVIGIALVVNGIKAAWIAAGFATGVMIRDINQVRATDFDVGIGLWAGVALGLLATILLITSLWLDIQAQRGGLGDPASE